MKKLALLLLIPIVCYSQVIPGIHEIQDEIQSILIMQKVAWNQGNIGGFMEYYWKSEDFTFQSGNKRLYGWHELLSRYEKSYSGEKMGTLDFTEIDIKVLSKDIAYVLGRWKVIQKESSKEGLFTIIFRRMPDGWRIIHDHTS
ncbi:MAG: DUF4440 domain-containing protein [Candidatus Aminicenantaceae bacterium]